jgi:protein tyrosine/serine phosphatase
LTLTDAQASRILDWEGCYNVRDLGGLETADGYRVRWGALVRSDLPTRLTETGRQALVDHGVRTIVDLRLSDEVADDWDSYPFRDGNAGQPTYVHSPFYGPDGLTEERIATYRAAQTRAEINQLDLDFNARWITAAVAAIADASAGGVLVHCHAGKDRTGAVVAIVLSTLGVSDDDIADDYALTALAIEPLIVEWLNDNSETDEEREHLRALAMPVKEAMLDTLAYMRERHGSAEAFLREGGVSQEQLDRLRERLLEDA